MTPNSFFPPAGTTTPNIQRAIDAATAGDIVNVQAGTYVNQLNVNKKLTLLGAQSGVDARTRSGPESIIQGLSGHTPVTISVADVDMDGFTVQGNTDGNVFGAGVYLAPGVSGTHFINNIVQQNIVGLFLANSSATDQAVISNNLFRDNTNPGSASGHGIYADQFTSGGTFSDVLIQNNTFTNTSFVTGRLGHWHVQYRRHGL